jgi:hypothetical protein
VENPGTGPRTNDAMLSPHTGPAFYRHTGPCVEEASTAVGSRPGSGISHIPLLSFNTIYFNFYYFVSFDSITNLRSPLPPLFCFYGLVASPV